jgi:hypothetical protein
LKQIENEHLWSNLEEFRTEALLDVTDQIFEQLVDGFV